MPGPENRTATGWRAKSRFYRRPPGPGWLVALAAIPLLLALIGLAVADRGRIGITAGDATLPGVPVPSLSMPAAPEPNAPGISFAPLSILRNGNVITLNGELPDIATRTGLIDMLTGLYGSSVQLVDNLNIKPGVKVPDAAALGSVFKASATMPDFKFRISGGTVALIGTASSGAVRSAVEAAATAAWPNLVISNNILVLPDAPEAPTPVAPSREIPRREAPSTPAAPGSPAPAPAGDCGNLQADVTALMATPVTFVTNGYALSPDTRRQLSRVAETLKGCRSAQVTVSGYTDNTGNDGINVPLSTDRAKSVADFLVAQGVPASSVTAIGFGSADPVASNATPDGRAHNRRVAITVS
ncbi:channel-forming protein ArfA/OmpATb [Mycolicibacter senuensis]|uniref:channel-forming protein ArfA/OmpATb n=1 Tax=Mycolicibacter senuensis TaxID=386913 RepID=UPI0026787AFE